ncbi:MAG: hypothetical protein ACFFAH_02060 [Promethearchaeota archaeon]
MLVASICLSNHRLNVFEEVIKSLLNQTTTLDKIEIFISRENFFLDSGINENDLPDLPVEYNIVENTGIQRRIIPCLQKYWDKPETKIIIMDDDRKYHKTNIESYYNYSEIYPDKALGFWSWSYKDGLDYWSCLDKEKKFWMFKDENSRLFHDDNALFLTDVDYCTYVDMIIPSTGMLVKPNFFLKEDVFNWERHQSKSIDLRYSNEVYINYCIAKNHIDRITIPFRDLPAKIYKGEKNITNRKTSYYKEKVWKSKLNQRKKWIQVFTKDNRAGKIVKE